uniref:ABC transporter substrate-binding protein n=1 Tax=Pararhizobium sp. IMCC3301 TaxID=3067904 RepID=UPI00274213E3|nr:ABC transporter substrate-binding protein [Pararhizobium sp. IMCC3301]
MTGCNSFLRLIRGSVAWAALATSLSVPYALAQPTEGELVVAVSQEPQDLAAQGAYKEINAVGIRNVLETLIAQDPVAGEMRGVLARNWERIDDSTLRFQLREGVMFHDGSAMDAAAVAASINWVWSLENSFTIQEYAGPGEITATAVSDGVVEVRSSKPDPLLEFRLSLNGISSAKQLEDDPKAHFSAPVGTGPYKFNEWAAGQYWTADYNPEWWGLTAEDAYGTSKPIWQSLRFVFRPEDAARVAMIQSGEAQIGMFPSADECERAEGTSGYYCVTGPSTTYLYGRLDHSLYGDERLKDTRIREAIFKAVDIEGLVDLYGLASVPPGQLAPKGTVGYNADVSAYEYDPAGAMALLEEAKADGVDVDSLSIEIVGRSSTPRIKPTVEALGAMLNSVGIGTEVKVQTPQEFNPRVRIAGYANEPGRQMMQVHVKQNPSNDFGLLLLSNYACPSMDDPTGASRSSVYCDEAFDAELAIALASTGAERAEKLKQLVKTVHDRHLILPLALLDRAYLVKDGIDFKFGTDHRFQAVYVTKSD